MTHKRHSAEKNGDPEGPPLLRRNNTPCTTAAGISVLNVQMPTNSAFSLHNMCCGGPRPVIGHSNDRADFLLTLQLAECLCPVFNVVCLGNLSILEGMDVD